MDGNAMKHIDRKKLIQRYYSVRAMDYDRQKSRTWKSSQGFGNEVTDELLDAFVNSEDKLVLEVGVGSGRNAVPLLQKSKMWFVGLDLSREMLELARRKMSSFKESLDLVLGDAESLPFVNCVFDGIICMSTMHYFKSQANVLKRFAEILKEKGSLVYGDLTVHELDDQGFLEMLENTVSKVHTRYCKPSEIQKLLEPHRFHVFKTRTVAYRKSYRSLMEDKGEYFDVTPETLQKCIRDTDEDAKEQYGLTDTELTLYYTIVTASRG
jgi:ubiquinone/menaquinone biosynthesis C-methylase UbiE